MPRKPKDSDKRQAAVASYIGDDSRPRLRVTDGNHECLEVRTVPAGVIKQENEVLLLPLIYVPWSPTDGFAGLRFFAGDRLAMPAHWSPSDLRKSMVETKLTGDFTMVLYEPKRICGEPKPLPKPVKKESRLAETESCLWSHPHERRHRLTRPRPHPGQRPPVGRGFNGRTIQ